MLTYGPIDIPGSRHLRTSAPHASSTICSLVLHARIVYMYLAVSVSEDTQVRSIDLTGWSDLTGAYIDSSSINFCSQYQTEVFKCTYVRMPTSIRGACGARTME